MYADDPIPFERQIRCLRTVEVGPTYVLAWAILDRDDPRLAALRHHFPAHFAPAASREGSDECPT